MAQLIINIPNDKVTRVMDALTGAWGYEPLILSEIEMIPNPETKAAFVKRHIIDDLKEVIYNYELTTAVKAAVATATYNAEQTVIRNVGLD